jgi:hypothetical protein
VGRCEKRTGIKPVGLLVGQMLEQDPYKDDEEPLSVSAQILRGDLDA